MADQADNIFEDNTQTTANNAPGGNGANVSGQDDLATMLGSIKNERGEPKYKTVADALNALRHSQEYISTLKQTKEELEQKLNELSVKASKVDELERVVLELTTRKDDTTLNQSSSLTEEKVAELVTRTLTQAQQKQVQQDNITLVTETVKKTFGEKASEVFYGKAKELGLTVEEFNKLAAKTPKAVLKLVGIDGEKPPVSNKNTTSAFNTEGFTPKQDSLVGRNTSPALIGATTEDLREEHRRSARMVEELAEQGLSINDLTNPKNYNKYFNKAR